MLECQETRKVYGPENMLSVTTGLWNISKDHLKCATGLWETNDPLG